MRLGVFELIDPPEGQVDMVMRVLAACSYPWRRVIPAVRRDPDQAVLIKWMDLGQKGTGLFYGGTYEIHLSTRYANWQRNVPFVFAHELGHLVDRATLRNSDREELTYLLHDSPETYRYDDESAWMNDKPRNDAHIREHNERWTRRDKHYHLMLNEAYADLFVATFIPSVFRYVRFTHWTSDLEAVQHITLQRSIQVFTDVPKDHPHKEGVERAAELGLVSGYPDGTFRPDNELTRGQAATIAVRQYDRILAETRS